jgi:hypothetical protein
MMSDLDADGSGSSQGGSGVGSDCPGPVSTKGALTEFCPGDWSYRITFSSDLWTRDAAVVLDKAALTKSIHEVADAGPCRTDHRGENRPELCWESAIRSRLAAQTRPSHRYCSGSLSSSSLASSSTSVVLLND